MEWHWPQYTYAILLVLGVGVSLGKDGQPRTGNHCFLLNAASASFAAWLLHLGGFW